MAVAKPLRLKSEVAKRRAQESSSALPIARVWVDSGVFHLDQSYDYLIPDNLSPHIATGIRIQVPFHGREVEALVLSRETVSESPVLKSVSKVLSIHSVATVQSLELVAAVAQRWAAHPYDILRSAIPPRVASVDKEMWVEPESSSSTVEISRRYIHLPPSISHIKLIYDQVEANRGRGSILVLLPDSRSVAQLHALLPEALILDSSLERTDRYRNFLQARFGRERVVIGTRSAVFAPLADLSHILIFDEGSELHYENRSPGWNVRDVAILRSRNEGVSLSLMGYSPSSEVARLIENNWIAFEPRAVRLEVSSFSQSYGELLPSRLISVIRKAAKSGPVLFLAPRKGYSQAIVCAKCRNVSLCHCGGKLVQKSANAPLECSICASIHTDWRCKWCQGFTPYLLGRGSERFAFEIGAAIPGEPIFQSTSEKVIEDFADQRGLIIATPGAIPKRKSGFSLVVILEAERLFNQSDLRAHERARELIFSTAAKVSPAGKVALVISDGHPIIAALASWKPSLISQRELRERVEVNLPPYSRAMTMDLASSESQSLMRGLIKAQEDGRLPMRTVFLGPSKLKDDIDRIVLLTPLEDGESLIALVHEFQRRRSSSKKTLASIRIDPYSLSR